VTTAEGLSWGRRYLMCPPQHFGVLYEINPWMHQEIVVDADLAQTQWDGLVGLLRAAGAEVRTREERRRKRRSSRNDRSAGRRNRRRSRRKNRRGNRRKRRARGISSRRASRSF